MKKAFNDLNIKIILGNLEITVLNIALEQFNKPMPRHSHGSASYEIHYISKGYGTVNIEEFPYKLSPGYLYTTGPFVEHEQIPEEKDPMVEYSVYFKIKKTTKNKEVSKNDIADKFEKVHFWLGEDKQHIYQVLMELILELDHKYPGYKENIKALLIQFIVKLVRNYENKTYTREESVLTNLEDSKDLIVEESFLYDYATVTLEKLADRLGLSKRQTQRFIAERYGKTFQEKKKEGKMAMARTLLKNKDVSVSDIAERLNYSSVQHFSHAFKEYYGYSASEYRKRL